VFMAILHLTISYGYRDRTGDWGGRREVFEVNENDTVEQLILVANEKLVVKGRGHPITVGNIHHDNFLPQLTDLKKTVKECGLVDGGEVEVWNGTKD